MVLPHVVDIFNKNWPWNGDDRSQILFSVNIIISAKAGRIIFRVLNNAVKIYSPEDLSDPGFEVESPALKADSLPTELPGINKMKKIYLNKCNPAPNAQGYLVTVTLSRGKATLTLTFLVFFVFDFYLKSPVVETLDSGICGCLKRGFEPSLGHLYYILHFSHLS